MKNKFFFLFLLHFFLSYKSYNCLKFMENNFILLLLLLLIYLNNFHFIFFFLLERKSVNSNYLLFHFFS